MHFEHILHIWWQIDAYLMHIWCILFCTLSCILCILSWINFVHIVHIVHITIHIVHILDEKSHWQGFHCLLPLLLGPPSQGPAVHIPPPTTITTVSWFIAESSGKVSCFSTEDALTGYHHHVILRLGLQRHADTQADNEKVGRSWSLKLATWSLTLAKWEMHTHLQPTPSHTHTQHTHTHTHIVTNLNLNRQICKTVTWTLHYSESQVWFWGFKLHNILLFMIAA